MRNNGQETCADLMEAETEHRRWERRRIQEDARKFEAIYNSVQERLRSMEVAI